MCPFCWSTMGLIVAGALSSGGLAALAVTVSGRDHAEEVLPNSDENNGSVHEHD